MPRDQGCDEAGATPALERGLAFCLILAFVQMLAEIMLLAAISPARG